MLPSFVQQNCYFLNLESDYEGLRRIWEAGREHQKRLEIFHADKTPGHSHSNTPQEMEADIRNALGAFSVVGGLGGVRQCCDRGKGIWERWEL